MAREPAYLWFVPTIGTDTLAILLKAPTNTLKAILRGCPTEFVFGVIDAKRKRYLGVAARIYDDPSSPLSVLKLQKIKEEHTALVNILGRRTNPIFLFDDLCRCVAWGNCHFKGGERNHVLSMLGDTKNLFIGKINQFGNRMLDRLQVSVDPTCHIEGAERIPILTTPIEITDFETIQHGAVGFSQTHQYDLRDLEEGPGQEISAWHALESLFPFGIIRGPIVEEGDTNQELIDILCHYEFGVFLFESKALSVYKSDPNKTMEKKVLSCQKHVRKALSQLVRAVHSIRQERIIKTHGGEQIELDPSVPPHCVVVLPELFQFGNWDAIVEECIRLSRNVQALIQILDMRELITLIGISGSKEAFDINLIERFQAFANVRSPFVRGIPPPKTPSR